MMKQSKQIMDRLAGFPKKTISLGELEKILDTDFSQDQISELVRRGLLTTFKGDVARTDGLYGRYRLDKSALQKDFFEEIKRQALSFHPLIDIHSYGKKPRSKWEQDKADIQKVNLYLLRHGLPEEPMLIQEWGYLLVGNEKWIEKGSGRRILKQIGLWDRLKITSGNLYPVFAINPQRYQKTGDGANDHCGLIVENKATFTCLLPLLPTSKYSVLVLGNGWEITATLASLAKLTGLPEVVYTYFGDIDPTGIGIWYHLYRQDAVLPEIPLYEALLEEQETVGKQSQVEIAGSVDAFEQITGRKIARLFANHHYLPQEALSREKLSWIMSSIIS